MLAHPITVSESLLLRSPKASEGQGDALGEAEALKRGNTVGVRDQVMDLVAGQGLKVSRVSDNELMPTPNTMDGLPARTPEKIAESKERTPGGYANLRETVVNDIPAMLPTPVVNDMGAGKTPEAWDEWTAKTREKHKNGNGHGPSLNIEMLRLLAEDKENDVSVSNTDNEGL